MLFDEDDGTYPELQVEFSSISSLLNAFAVLLNLADSKTAHEGIVVWREGVEESLVLPPFEAALKVCSSEVEPFELVLPEIRYEEQTIPNLGLFIDPPRKLIIDYRQGAHWNFYRALALFEVLTKYSGTITSPWWRHSVPDVDQRLSTFVSDFVLGKEGKRN